MEFNTAKLRIEPESPNGKWEEFEVQYNPSHVNITRSVNIKEEKVPGMDTSILQSVSSEAENMDLELVFDTYDPPSLKNNGQEGGTSVTDITKKLERLVSVDPKLHRTPQVEFVWGKIIFRGLVTNMSQQFTMFLSNGTPVRAKVNLSLKHDKDVEKILKEHPLESPDRTKVHTLCQGEQLWHLAWQEYRDPELWREIAKANDISDPLKLTPGQLLKIPAL